MRLTVKTGLGYQGSQELRKHIAGEEQILIDKLGQLEDIEDELGIDLITLFKALKKGAYDDLGNYYKNPELCYEIGEITLWLGRPHNIKDYGKTWALTKEEIV